MVKVYGASDDLVEIENSQYKQDEIDCFDSDVHIRFVDGTVIRLGYPKKTRAMRLKELFSKASIEICPQHIYEECLEDKYSYCSKHIKKLLRRRNS